MAPIKHLTGTRIYADLSFPYPLREGIEGRGDFQIFTLSPALSHKRRGGIYGKEKLIF